MDGLFAPTPKANTTEQKKYGTNLISYKLFMAFRSYLRAKYTKAIEKTGAKKKSKQ